MSQAFLQFLGTRGSMLMAGQQYQEFGGNTSCVFLSLGGQTIVLDAGSGLMRLTPQLLGSTNTLSMLLTHTHIDHIIGLPCASVMQNSQLNINIYGATRGGLTIKQQLGCMLNPPLWPVGVESFAAKVEFFDVQKEFWLGDVKVTTAGANHPGGCTMFKLQYKDISVVYATDNEMAEPVKQELVRFAKGCNVLICDGQYSNGEYQVKKGYGHTRRELATQLAVECGCKHFFVFHHDPQSTDEVLRAAELEISALIPNGHIAKEEMRIEL